MDVAGSVALVTGANRGLGAAFCRALLDEGASKVYAGARDPDTIKVAGVIPVRLDITSPADVAAAVAQCSDTTLLVHNAGILTGTSALADDAGGMKPGMSSDGVHPTEAGYAIMAPLAEKAITEAMQRKTRAR